MPSCKGIDEGLERHWQDLASDRCEIDVIVTEAVQTCSTGQRGVERLSPSLPSCLVNQALGVLQVRDALP